MDDVEKAVSMMRDQTSEDGVDYWEPVFDDDGSMIRTERPTQLAAFQTLLRYVDELRRLVECAPKSDGGIRVDNRNAFRMTLEKISMVGPVANLSLYRLKSCETPGPGVVTSTWTPTFKGSSITSIVNDISLLPFGRCVRDQRHIDNESVSLFMRRYAALKEVVETLAETSQADSQPINVSQQTSSLERAFRLSGWFSQVTDEALYPDLLKQAVRDGRLQNSKKRSTNRWMHDVEEVAGEYPQYAEVLRKALEADSLG